MLSVPARLYALRLKRELSVRRTKWLMLRVNINYGHAKAIRSRHMRLQLGISNGVMTEITGGISEGDVIITGATSGKMPGDGASASQGDSGAQKESSPSPSRPKWKKVTGVLPGTPDDYKQKRLCDEENYRINGYQA